MTQPSLAEKTGRKAETKRELQWIRIPLHGEPAGDGDMDILDQPFPAREAGDLTELTSSVRLHGVLSPLLLRQSGNHLQIVCGYRRYLAARAAGITQVPALITPLRDAEAIRSYLSEDAIRRPLTPQAQNEALQTLKELRDRMTDTFQGEPITPPRIPRAEGGIRPPTQQARISEISCLDAPVRTPEPDRTPPPRLVSKGVGEPDGKNQRDRSALQLLERVRNFLDVVRASKTISAPHTETLLDDILEVVETCKPHGISRLSAHEEGDFLASHSILVTALCARVGNYIGWEGATYRSFLLGGFLHDVGMALVHQTALHSPQSLPEKDRTRIESHTRIGCALISATGAWDNQVAHAARDHHERWNGSGYPEGKKGTEVAFPARLVGFLDTYAALITPRPHRNALQPDAARQRLAKALELGLFDLSLYTVLEEVLSSWPGAKTVPQTVKTPHERSGKDIELKGGLVTMLSNEST